MARPLREKDVTIAGPKWCDVDLWTELSRKTDNIETAYPWMREEQTWHIQDDHPFFDEWQAVMDEWEAATSKELNIAYGTEQVVKATPEMKTTSVEQHMERNMPNKRLTHGAWEWILRRL